MSAPDVKAVCTQCNGRGYMRGLGVGSPDSIYACRECSGEGWRWVRVWTDDDAQARREWVAKHLPHLVDNAHADLSAASADKVRRVVRHSSESEL